MADTEAPGVLNRQRARQSGRLGIKCSRRPASKLSIMRSDQTVGESASAVPPMKQSLLDGRFILEGQLSGLEQAPKHAEHGISFKSVTAPKDPFRFDQTSSDTSTGLRGLTIARSVCGASSLLGIIRDDNRITTFVSSPSII